MNTPGTARISSRSVTLDQGREAVRLQAWDRAFALLSAADREERLEPRELEQLAMAAHLNGKEADSVDLLARAHQAFAESGDIPSAARCAVWLTFELFMRGEVAQAGGWLARARRILENHEECAENGYVLLPAGLRAAREGNIAAAYEAFCTAGAIGERFRDPDLMAMARQGQGRTLIRKGEIERGVSLLDEAMVAVTAGEVSPIAAGTVYCSVIEACGEILDLRRAQEWTAALDRWCAGQQGLVPYRGHCLARRAEILQVHGSWKEALEQAMRACERLSEPTAKPAVGAAFYRVAELHRLRGEFAEAEECYAQASRWQTAPQPGCALLRLAQGRVEAAYAAIRHVADGTYVPGARATVLAALVEIALAANDIPAARAAANEIAAIAASLRARLLDAISGTCTAAVLLAEGDPRTSAARLRESLVLWRDLGAPYEAARVRVLLAQACRQQGNNDTAELELKEARVVFRELGAAVDLARLDALRHPAARGGPVLTSRELEVLKLVAAGMTNRGIAAMLSISEKTVARHLNNIFVKLDLPSRAAATAYAYKNQLV
ncbi:MAG: LuxR C-terminal-related transcriptional regulator [Bryobacteraceae bacterium]